MCSSRPQCLIPFVIPPSLLFVWVVEQNFAIYLRFNELEFLFLTRFFAEIIEFQRFDRVLKFLFILHYKLKDLRFFYYFEILEINI